jgi:hypothetical protein
VQRSEQEKELGLPRRVRLRSTLWLVLEYLCFVGYYTSGGVHGAGAWLLTSIFLLLVATCVHAGVEFAVPSLRGSVHPAIVVILALLPLSGAVVRC